MLRYLSLNAHPISQGLKQPLAIGLLLLLPVTAAPDLQAKNSEPLSPLLRTVDLDVGETRDVTLHDGSRATLELLEVEADTDPIMDAVREVRVTVLVNGERAVIKSGNYHLPIPVGGVQVDCPVTADYLGLTTEDWWGLERDARLRVWPGDSPYIWPGTFVYPVNQKWLASLTWYSNEPVNSPRPDGSIYYHAGLDLGGAEDMVEIYAATDGTVVSTGGQVLESVPDDNPINPRYDVVYIRDARGWYYRYSHFDSIHPDLEVGRRVRAGQKLGMLGKEGGSGGWTHLHFEIVSRQPSGRWGTQDGYAFLWQAYRRQFDPELLAVARPQKVVRAGDPVILSAANTWSKGPVESYEWSLTDGTVKSGVEIERRYEDPGTYSEIVKVTDMDGNYAYDFAVVSVFPEGSNGKNGPPGIHATYFPTRDIRPGERVFFQVRARGVSEGYDVWDFADGTEPFRVKSNIEPGNHAKVGYALTSHRFEKPGDYLVSVRRETSRGTATARLFVKVRN